MALKASALAGSSQKRGRRRRPRGRRSQRDGHFRESQGGLLEVVEGEAAGNNVERSRGERCLIDIADASSS
jgi:hypothetical protein